MSWLLLSHLALASPWEGPCEGRGRETWGVLVDVTDQGSGAETDERFAHVRVHRPLEAERLGRSVRASRIPEPGMVLCKGDWVETWHQAEVSLEEAGARALLTLRGGSLVWLDTELRQVRGIVDYYVLDGPRSGDTPVPVALGYSAVTASRQDSTFRVELLDPGAGDALISVSDRDDLFGSDGRAHGVTLEGLDSGALRVPGGSSVRVGEGRRLSGDAAASREAEAELDAARDALEGVASQRWEAPPPPTAWDEPVRRHRLVVQGASVPDAVWIDGARVRAPAWRRVRHDGEPALVLVGGTDVADGLHEVVVDTWLESSTTAVRTDARSDTLVARRPDQAGGARVRARRRYTDRWTRPELVELRPSVGRFVGFSEVSTTTFPRGPDGEVVVREEQTRIDSGGHLMGQLPVRLQLHGGRLWAQLTALGGYLPPSELSSTQPVEARGLPWAGGEAFVGTSGGQRLGWELGAGLTLGPRIGRVDRLPRQTGVTLYPTPAGRLWVGTGWQLAVDGRAAGMVCMREGQLVGGFRCGTLSLDAGLSVVRDLGSVAPFVRLGLRSAYTVEESGQGRSFRVASGSLGALGLSVGSAVRLRAP